MKNLMRIFNLFLLPFLWVIHSRKVSFKEGQRSVPSPNTPLIPSLLLGLALIFPNYAHAADTADAEVTITASPSIIVNAGAEIDYDVTITSLGGKIESDIEVTSTFSADFSYVSMTGTDWTCTSSGSTVVCRKTSNINNNASSSFSFRISPTANGTTTSITNDISITAVGNTDPDPDPSNNSASYTTTVNPIADVSITKVDSKDPVISNERLDYTINVSNAGPYPAEVIKVNDFLPAGTIYHGASGTNWSCALSAGIVACDYTGTLAAGATTSNLTLDIEAPSTAGTITNTAKVSAFTTDILNANDTASESTTVASSATNLSIALTATPDPVNTSSILTYTIIVDNNGPLPATEVRVIDALPANVQFTSIDGGTDWSCGQGSYIICDYIGNSGVFNAGAGVSPITINVNTPAVDDNVTNSVSVNSNVGEVDISDNNASVTVEVAFSTSTISGGRPFEKLLQYNVFGDMKLIGNVNIWKQGTAEPGSTQNNNNFDMRFADADSDASTFNSSSATLNLGDPSYQVVWAGLYWLGHICVDTYARCDNSNNGGSYAAASARKHELLLKSPGDVNYRTIVANNLDFVMDNGNQQMLYGGFADVTEYVKDQGDYSVANLRTSEGRMWRWGGFGGWALQVIYEDQNQTLHYKNVSIFNGFQAVIGGTGVSITADGFVTPRSGPVTGSLGFFVGDGDAGSISGDFLNMYNANSGNMETVTDTLNYTNTADRPKGGGIFNGSITELGNYFNTRSNPHINNLGIDIDRIDVSNFMTNSQTSTNFQFISGSDIHTINLISFATDLTTPIINNFAKSAEIIDANGTSRPAGSGVPILPGTELLYTLTFRNTGDEVATEVEIFDDFDFDGLTDVLNLDSFDASKIKLSIPNSTTTWQNNPNCGYTTSENKVWCKIDQIEINEAYTMQFSVTLKTSLGASEDMNATNTAYVNYKNANTDAFVILVSNEHGNFGGQSNTFDAGTITLATGGFFARGMDAVNNNYPYDDDKNITTKVVNDPFDLKLVYLSETGENITYTGGFEMPVILTLASDPRVRLQQNFSKTNPAPMFTDGLSEITATGLNLSNASQQEWVQMSFINWNELGWSEANIRCVLMSTTGGNYKGLPQCLSADSKIRSLFAPQIAADPYIADVCLGDRLILTGGQVPACSPQAYSSWSLNSSRTIMPENFRHIYGCYQCLAGGINSTRRSTDDFSIRPDQLTLATTDPDFPDLLRSGRDYNLSLAAVDASNNRSTDYNQTKNNLDVNQTLYFSNGTADTNGSLNGTVTFSPNDFNITNGISVAKGTTSNDVVGYSFDDVANLDIIIQDPSWSAVDKDDTPQDCNTTTMSIAGNTINIEAAAYICGQLNTTFIPDHFGISNLQLFDHAQGRITYLSNDLNMSAHIGVTISALNADNVVTQNFRQFSGYYENPVSVDLNVTRTHPLGNNVIIKDLPTETLLGFGSSDFNSTLDTNGTHTIVWNEADQSRKLMFNYDREIDQVVNPFKVNNAELNITVQSTYNATAGTAVITGNNVGSGDQNATFYYARIRPALTFYENISTSSVITPVALDVYCALGYTPCADLGIDTVNAQIADANWWLSLDHNMSTQDGNITLQKGAVTEGSSSTWDVNTTVDITSEGIDGSTTVSQGNDAVLPLTVEIELDNTNTSTWLVHNPADSILWPTPLYRVRFIGDFSGWTGVGETGHVLETNASHINTERLNW